MNTTKIKGNNHTNKLNHTMPPRRLSHPNRTIRNRNLSIRQGNQTRRNNARPFKFGTRRVLHSSNTRKSHISTPLLMTRHTNSHSSITHSNTHNMNTGVSTLNLNPLPTLNNRTHTLPRQNHSIRPTNRYPHMNQTKYQTSQITNTRTTRIRRRSITVTPRHTNHNLKYTPRIKSQPTNSPSSQILTHQAILHTCRHSQRTSPTTTQVLPKLKRTSMTTISKSHQTPQRHGKTINDLRSQ